VKPRFRTLPCRQPELRRYINVTDRSRAISSSRRRRIEPRLIAPVAFLLAFLAIALEIVYAVGHFFSETVQKIP
jgi:hypothetical protein